MPAFAFVGLVAIALLQFSLANHQFEHIADEAIKYCRVCVQYERLDDVPLPSSQAQISVSPTPIIVTGNEAFATTERSDSRRARAPPRS